MTMERAQWGSRLAFILAAAGSAIGLGNIWKFPYITGMNGGGWFVLIYLACIALVGMPIMMAEVFLGRSTQKSPVGAFRAHSRPGSPWLGAGWLGVAAGFIILSYYSVVAGWSMHYAVLSARGTFTGMSAEQVGAVFSSGVAEAPGVFENATLNVAWHIVFMAITIGIVIAGVKAGLERASKVMMPLLFLIIIAMLVRAIGMDGFGRAAQFVFGFHADDLTAAGVLEALGHSFFTLSLGMGAMITYGSYLKRDADLVTTSATVAVLDTSIALMACLVIFPIIFTFGMEPGRGPGLVFVSLPIAFGQISGGAIWATAFFVLLFFAALTSAISLLEVTVSYFIDERGWSRAKATLACGIAITILGVPSALSGGSALFGPKFQSFTATFMGEDRGMNWFDFFDYVASNWMLPLGGLFIALFVAWRVGGAAREQGFRSGTRFGRLYWGWVFLLRFIVPVGVVAVFLHAIGVI